MRAYTIFRVRTQFFACVHNFLHACTIFCVRTQFSMCVQKDQRNFWIYRPGSIVSFWDTRPFSLKRMPNERVSLKVLKCKSSLGLCSHDFSWATIEPPRKTFDHVFSYLNILIGFSMISIIKIRVLHHGLNLNRLRQQDSNAFFWTCPLPGSLWTEENVYSNDIQWHEYLGWYLEKNSLLILFLTILKAHFGYDHSKTWYPNSIIIYSRCSI